jgi:hypothetical protein
MRAAQSQVPVPKLDKHLKINDKIHPACIKRQPVVITKTCMLCRKDFKSTGAYHCRRCQPIVERRANEIPGRRGSVHGIDTSFIEAETQLD